MSEKIFSGESSKDFWKAVRKAQVDILYDYGCKAQEIEQQRDDLLDICKRVKGLGCLRDEESPKCKKGDMCCICATEAAIANCEKEPA